MSDIPKFQHIVPKLRKLFRAQAEEEENELPEEDEDEASGTRNNKAANFNTGERSVKEE